MANVRIIQKVRIIMVFLLEKKICATHRLMADHVGAAIGLDAPVGMTSHQGRTEGTQQQKRNSESDHGVSPGAIHAHHGLSTTGETGAKAISH
jgi:hypothetical protein